MDLQRYLVVAAYKGFGIQPIIFASLLLVAFKPALSVNQLSHALLAFRGIY